MKFTVLTLFPEIVQGYAASSIMAKAIERGIIDVETVNIRDFALDRHRTCDDAPYGGGYGMVMKAEPIAGAHDSVGTAGKRVVYVTPSGSPYTQKTAQRYSAEEELVILCGRYEGIDQRIVELYVHEQVSVGDYVLSSGEVAALAIIDSVYRLVDGVISAGSLEEETHVDALLEYPHYTRPVEFRGLRVPDVLLSGNHASIEAWRRRQRIERTLRVRPDLMAGAELSDEERILLREDGGNDGSHTGS